MCFSLLTWGCWISTTSIFQLFRCPHFMVLNLPFGDGLPEATAACCTRRSIRSKRCRTLVGRSTRWRKEHWKFQIGEWCVTHNPPPEKWTKKSPWKSGGFFLKEMNHSSSIIFAGDFREFWAGYFSWHGNTWLWCWLCTQSCREQIWIYICLCPQKKLLAPASS